MQPVQAEMHENLMIAMDRIKKLSQKEKDFAESHIKEIITLKCQMETIAAHKGYAQACKPPQWSQFYHPKISVTQLEGTLKNKG